MINMFGLPMYTPDQGANAQTNNIIFQQLGFAGAALAALNSQVGTLVNYATTAINVPIPAAMAQGLDFDFSMEAFNDLLNRKPTAPTTNPITVTIPIVPVIDVPNIQAVILSELWNDIYTKLNDDITNGGYGIDTADEILIWERNRERELLDLAGQYDEADEFYAGAGYKFPPGALIKSKQKAKQTFQNKMATLNRDMTIERLKMFVEARKFALENGVKFGELFIEIGKLRSGIYESEVKGALGSAEILQKNEMFKVDLFRSQIDAYGTEAKVLASLYDLASTQQEREMRVQIAVLQANIEIAKVQLEQAVEQAKLRLSGAQASAEVYKSICASALGTIHASAGISQGSSIGWSYGKSEQKSENYNESAQEG
jgi:hypothetical protein